MHPPVRQTDSQGWECLHGPVAVRGLIQGRRRLGWRRTGTLGDKVHQVTDKTRNGAELGTTMTMTMTLMLELKYLTKMS